MYIYIDGRPAQTSFLFEAMWAGGPDNILKSERNADNFRREFWA